MKTITIRRKNKTITITPSKITPKTLKPSQRRRAV